MNRNTKLVLLLSLFALVCLAILWGRWFPDNRGQDLTDVAYTPDSEAALVGGPAYGGTSPTSPKPFSPKELIVGSPNNRFQANAAEPLGISVPKPGADAEEPDESEQPQRKSEPGADVAPRAGWHQYTIKDGDSPWKIAQRWLGDGNRHQEILDANPKISAAKLKPGHVIWIPAKDRAASGVADAGKPEKAPASEPAKPRASGSYTVQARDTLTRIAANALGSSGRWKEIADLNRLSEPYNIREGQSLQLPAR